MSSAHSSVRQSFGSEPRRAELPPQRITRPDTVVITGAGLITCLGLDRQSNWSRVLRGQCGFRALTEIESSLPPDRTGGQAEPLPPHETENTAREVAYLRLALVQALRDAGLGASLPYPPHRCGLILGTTLHGMRHAGRYLRTGDLTALASFLSSSTMREAAAGLGIEGFAMTLCAACSSGLAAINAAKTLLEAGMLDMVVSGGYDVISEYAYGGFSSMRLVTEGRPRPFATGRDGMKLGEGYAAVVLERQSRAVARGAAPLAEILGFGESCDAHHLSKPHPQGLGAAAAMRNALRQARLSADEIDLIAAHATATLDNDAAEFAALSGVFSEALEAIPLVAFKTHVGHTLGGAGAVELILSMMALREGVIPPCADIDGREATLRGLCLAAGDAKPTALRHTINTSLGFGGCNTSVVLGKPKPISDNENRGESFQIDNRQSTNGASLGRPVAITGIGVLFPGIIGVDGFRARLEEEGNDGVAERTGTIPADQLDALLHARRARRISDYVRLTLAATALAYENAGIHDFESFGEHCSAVLGTAHGSAAYSAAYYRQIVADGLLAANPMLFAEGVPNAAAAHLSTAMSIKGLCQTAIGTRTAGLEALCLAAARIRSGLWTRAVVSAADEFFPLINDAYRVFGLHEDAQAPSVTRRDRGFVTSCGAVTLVLENTESALRRGAAIWGEIGTCSGARCDSIEGKSLRPNAVRHVWSGLGRPPHVVGSANSTWIDRMERNAWARAEDAGAAPPVVSSIYGHVAETFSAGPLAALAAVLIRGKLPRWRLDEAARLRVADGSEGADRFGIIGTDYAGSVVGIEVCKNS